MRRFLFIKIIDIMFIETKWHYFNRLLILQATKLQTGSPSLSTGREKGLQKLRHLDAIIKTNIQYYDSLRRYFLLMEAFRYSEITVSNLQMTWFYKMV